MFSTPKSSEAALFPADSFLLPNCISSKHAAEREETKSQTMNELRQQMNLRIQFKIVVTRIIDFVGSAKI
jgi:hypothetical protein